VEYLFKHATYGLANKDLPRWNVGNADEENLRPELMELWEQFPESKGLTEVRLISADAAKTTLEQIQQDLKWHLKVDELVLKYGIQTFGGVLSGRGTVQIPHRFWRFKPHHKPEKPDPGSTKTQALIYKEDLKEYEGELKQCWDPNWAGWVVPTAFREYLRAVPRAACGAGRQPSAPGQAVSTSCSGSRRRRSAHCRWTRRTQRRCCRSLCWS